MTLFEIPSLNLPQVSHVPKEKTSKKGQALTVLLIFPRYGYKERVTSSASGVLERVVFKCLSHFSCAFKITDWF